MDHRVISHYQLRRRYMKTRYVLTLCTALVVGGALIAGSANALGKADEKTPINDSWLTAKTKIALFADARVKGSEINVETAQGAVTMRGKVDTDAAKQAAEGIAKGIDGVKSVKNDLQVIAPAKRSAGPHDQCPGVLDCLAGPRREVGEERSYGEREGLRSYSHDTRALRPSISEHRDVGGRQSRSLSQPFRIRQHEEVYDGQTSWFKSRNADHVGRHAQGQCNRSEGRSN
jgi:hyperosmotically inducible protein